MITLLDIHFSKSDNQCLKGCEIYGDQMIQTAQYVSCVFQVVPKFNIVVT